MSSNQAAVAQRIERVTHKSEGCWFLIFHPSSHVKISLSKTQTHMLLPVTVSLMCVNVTQYHTDTKHYIGPFTISPGHKNMKFTKVR